MKLTHRLADYGDNLALLTSDGETLSYRQLCQRRDAYCVYLQSYPKHSLLALTFAPTVAAVTAYLAALYAGYPLLLLDASQDKEMHQGMLESLGVIAVIDSAGVITSLPGPHAGCRPDLALLLSTSGSSGNPKSVMLSVAHLEANARSICDYLPIHERARAITSLPLHYSYGLSVLNSHLYAGASIVLSDAPVMSREFWQAMREYEVTGLAGVPFHYQMFRQLRLERMSLPALTYMTQAGGKLDPSLQAYVKTLSAAKHLPIYLMYGQTEATARMAYLPPEHLEQHADCIGKPVLDGEFVLRSTDSGHSIDACHVSGELCYQGPNVMLGYAGSAADLSSTATLAELRTGDLAERLPNGLFRVTGRLTRMIKLHGKRLQLDHIEQGLQHLGFDVAVTGDDDRLLISVREDDASQRERLAQYMREKLQLHPGLFTIRSDDEWPRLGNGKLDYVALKRRFEHF